MTRSKHCIKTCPICDGFTKVRHAFKRAACTRRSHQCQECGHKFMTEQQDPQVVPYSERFIGKLSPAERHQILTLRDAGKTYLDIACEFDVSESTVRDVVKRRYRATRRSLVAASVQQMRDKSHAV